MDNGEFDRMIRFEEGEDKYYYCFKDEGCHIIYHRFLPEDYADFGFKPDKKIRNRGNTKDVYKRQVVDVDMPDVPVLQQLSQKEKLR